MEHDCSGKKNFPENLELFFEMVDYATEELCCMTASDLLPGCEKERMVKKYFFCEHRQSDGL